MKLILIICVLLITGVYSGCPFHGEEYQSYSASHKMELLTEKLEENPENGTFYTIRMPEMFIQDNNLSFTHDGDDFPGQGPFDLATRHKLIHTVGMTAECEFVSNNQHSYTGIFKGGKFGYVRFSSATKPSEGDFTPGFTFKFFRDGVKSANIITMYNLLGQGNNSNPFLHDQTNHVPFFNSEGADLARRMLLKNFQKISQWPTLLGLSNAAKFDQYGNEEKEINFPYRIIFHPTKQAREQIPNDLKMKSGSTPFYIPAMEGIQVETLFEVYVQKTPMSEDVEKIGEIKQKTPFTASSYGDYKMFLQHQFFEEDLAMHPEWEPYVTKIVENEEATIPNYERPDLPFDE